MATKEAELVSPGSSGKERGPRYQLIDSDVHPLLPGRGLTAVLDYMPKAWRRRFEMKGHDLAATALTHRFAHPTGNLIRMDTQTEAGPGGADREFMREDLLDRFGVDRAILNNFQIGALAVALAGPDESVVLCSAFNDYFIEEWTAGEPRFRYTICVPSQDPEAAAKEVRRRGDDPGVAAVFMPLVNTRMGNRYYYPVYEAAIEVGLPIFSHFSGCDFIYQGAPVTFGMPESFAERYIDLGALAAPNVASLVFNGVFERYPTLKFVFAEYGFSWLPALMWRMDRVWRAARIEVPWVKKPPHEYVHDHLRFTTQPVDEPEPSKHLHAVLDMLGDDLLLFSTDYPHWDNDTPDQVFRRLPADQKERLFWRNAAEVFRLD